MSAKYRYEAGIADALVRGDEGETADAGGGGYGAIHWVAKDTEMRGVEGDFVGRREQVKLRISRTWSKTRLREVRRTSFPSPTSIAISSSVTALNPSGSLRRTADSRPRSCSRVSFFRSRSQRNKM